MLFSNFAFTALPLLAGLALATEDVATGVLGNAPVVANNPLGAVVGAQFAAAGNDTISGSVIAVTGPSGTGVLFSVSLSGFKSDQAPYSYHVHQLPVPVNGSCAATLLHLDPYHRGVATPCDAAKPETCQVGDLSGKWGEINQTSFSASYLDLYSSLNPDDVSYFANLSIVIHNKNSTRVACSNFFSVTDVLAKDGSCIPTPIPTEAPATISTTPVTLTSMPTSPASSSGSPTADSTASGTTTPGNSTSTTLPEEFTGTASTVPMSKVALVIAGFVGVLMCTL